MATCALGVCSIACNAGFKDCDGKNANGGEIQTNATDVNNCGGCASVCSTSHISATCASGVCNGTCAAGYASGSGGADPGGNDQGGNAGNAGSCFVKVGLTSTQATGVAGGTGGVLVGTGKATAGTAGKVTLVYNAP